MKKEILTKERIKSDLLGPAKPFTTVLLFGLAFASLAFMGYVMLLRNDWKAYVAVTGLGICGLILFCLMIRLPIERKRIKQGKFHIVQDTLVNKAEFVRTSVISNRASDMRDRLDFAVYGEIFLLHPRYYRWSRLYSMRPKDLFDYSSVGDTFYLVICDGDRKNKPVMLYKTEMFELKEEWDES